MSKTVISARGASPDDEQNGTKNGISNGSEWAKCIFLFFFLFIAGMSNWAVLAYTHDYVPRESLPDIVFSLVSEQRWASSLGELVFKKFKKKLKHFEIKFRAVA